MSRRWKGRYSKRRYDRLKKEFNWTISYSEASGEHLDAMYPLLNAYDSVIEGIIRLENLMGTGTKPEDLYCDTSSTHYWREMCRLVEIRKKLFEHIEESGQG